MANMKKEKNIMPVQDPKVRNKNFLEVATGYSLETAIDEAKRCLQCKHKPCVNGCPVNVRIPEFIAELAEGNIEKANEILKSTNSLPGICGRVCPQETQCEQLCVRGIKNEPVAIGRLERFVADYMIEKESTSINIDKNNLKVAVVGSGPAGLACAGDLAKMGYDVTVFEALHKAGGVLMYGIPEFRLPKALVQKEIDALISLGVKIKTNMVIGRILDISDLKADFDAIFIGTGAGLPRFMNIPGEHLNGVYSANEFLTRINLMKAYKYPEYKTPIAIGEDVFIVGGGNVAMDAARCAKRLGAKNVTIVYRRSKDELPARDEEIHHAIEEEIEFMFLSNPISISGDDEAFVTEIELEKMLLGEKDESGRRSVTRIKNSQFTMRADTVVIAIGQTPNPLIKKTTEGLNTNNRGGIVVNEETNATSIEGVYAGGDIVTGAATVILAMGAGKKAATAINEYLKGRNL